MTAMMNTVAALAIGGAACAASARAQEITVTPIAEARIRYETAEQDDIVARAHALTMRGRGGARLARGAISASIIGQGILAAVDTYYDGLTGAASRPLVADPQNIALYIAQLQYSVRDLTVTAGRQKIALDDERFVGNVAFRNNAQTFDAVRAEIAPAQGLKLDLSYVWSVRTIWGIDGKEGRQQAVGGDSVLANIGWKTPIGTLTGFAYLVDQDEAAVQGYRLSSQTYGARLAGSHVLATSVKLAYQASYARQSDWGRNPGDYRAGYWLADASLDVHGWKIGAGYEVLGAAKGRVAGSPFTSFQTPLGTNFKFQGWADKFLTTPPDGVRDLYMGGGYGAGQMGSFSAVSLQGTWHRFESDRFGQHYGNEIDLLASAKVRGTTIALRYAHYEAETLATDTDKLWVQLDWAI